MKEYNDQDVTPNV